MNRPAFAQRGRLVSLACLLLASALTLTGCGGSKVGSESGAAITSSCVKTGGDTIKIGFLNSRSGTMAISENTVYASLTMAKDEINAAGGVNGKQLEVIAEDGASEPTTFAEKAQKLISSELRGGRFRWLDLGKSQGDAARVRKRQLPALLPGSV